MSMVLQTTDFKKFATVLSTKEEKVIVHAFILIPGYFSYIAQNLLTANYMQL